MRNRQALVTFYLIPVVFSVLWINASNCVRIHFMFIFEMIRVIQL